jgi:hypothetical protein
MIDAVDSEGSRLLGTLASRCAASHTTLPAHWRDTLLAMLAGGHNEETRSG